MPYQRPSTGLVIRYAYLWHNEWLQGHEEGVKDRPCAVVLVAQDVDGKELVTVLPITHAPPSNPELAVEISAAIKLRLGLDSIRSWVVLSETNRFIWPGPDLRPIRNGEPESVAYGVLPEKFIMEVRKRFVAAIR